MLLAQKRKKSIKPITKPQRIRVNIDYDEIKTSVKKVRIYCQNQMHLIFWGILHYRKRKDSLWIVLTNCLQRIAVVILHVKLWSNIKYKYRFKSYIFFAFNDIQALLLQLNARDVLVATPAVRKKILHCWQHLIIGILSINFDKMRWFTSWDK